MRTDGRLQVQQDQAIGLTTTVGSTALADNVWYTVRLVYDKAAGGVLKVWLNVPLEIDATHATAGTSVDQITVSGPASPNQYHYDDFSITDSAGFQPFGQITRRDPVAVGSLTQFTPTESFCQIQRGVKTVPYFSCCPAYERYPCCPKSSA